MSAGLPTLAGPRVVLRPFVLADASDVQRLAGERDIAATTALIPHPYEDGMAEAWIATHADRFARDEAATFAVTLGATGELLGAISLQIRREHARAELGYWIGKPYWGRGYCTEAGGLVLRFAFEELRLARVFAAHFKSNEASGRVLQRLGLRPEGVFRSHMLKWGAPQDAVFCGILAAEFRPPRGGESGGSHDRSG